MRIAFVYGAWSLGGRRIDMRNVWTSERGLTGSELSCLCYAREMARRGHDVTLCLAQGEIMEWEGVRILPLHMMPTTSETVDVVYAWNEPDVLRPIGPGVLRMVNQQVNDFGYCRPGYDSCVDVYTSPSASHCEFIRKETPSPHKWAVVSNGCDPNLYKEVERRPASVIWASSPDRGLHLLLQAWPTICHRVPGANLRIFYNMDRWLREFDGVTHHTYPDFREFAYRATYIALALRRMDGMNIEKYGSVSRERMASEMSQAMVLAYPCDTVRFTEGFSVTTMEACAAGVTPVIAGVDSLGQIYGAHIPTIEPPVQHRIGEFTETVIRALTDSEFRKSVTTRGRQLAYSHRWSVLAADLEGLIRNRLKR